MEVLGYDVSVMGSRPSQLDIRLEGSRFLRFFSDQVGRTQQFP